MMAKRDYVDFQDRTHPLAYLITFRCYGTWLHGDERGSVDRRHDNRHDTPDMPANKRMFEDEKASLRSSAVVLNCEQREVITSAIREVCDHVGIRYTPVNTRTNHVHAVASGESKPEHIMNSFKSYATRKLREASLLSEDIKPWARHGSTPYLWTEEELRRAIDYVLNGQGDEPFR